MIHQCYKRKQEFLVSLSRGSWNPRNYPYHPHLAPTQHNSIEPESDQFFESKWSHQFLEASFPMDHITQRHHANLYFVLTIRDRIFVFISLFPGLLRPCTSTDMWMRTQRNKSRVWSPLSKHYHLAECASTQKCIATQGLGPSLTWVEWPWEGSERGNGHCWGHFIPVVFDYWIPTTVQIQTWYSIRSPEPLPTSSTKPKVKGNLWSCERWWEKPENPFNIYLYSTIPTLKY